MSPDLFCLDPLGLDICVLLCGMEYTLPIIIFGLSRNTQEVVRALDLGADHYVASSSALNELAARVRALLQMTQEIL